MNSRTSLHEPAAGRAGGFFRRPAGGWFVLLLICLARGAMAGEIWISPAGVDGSGRGMAGDPYVCASQATFDSLLSGPTVPTNSTIHLLAGLFHTAGNLPLKAGWKLRGAGMDATTVQMVDVPALLRANPGFPYMTNFSSYEIRVLGVPPLPYRNDNVEVSDLTVDCNLQNQSAPLAIGAVRLQGANTRISRARAINWGSEVPGVECFIFGIGDGGKRVDYAIQTNCVIADCVVEQPAPVKLVQGADGFTIGGNPTNLLDAGSVGWVWDAVITDCKIYSVTAGNGPGQPLYFAGLAIGNGIYGAKMTGNMVVNLGGNANAIAGSCGSLVHCEIENNMFLNVAKGIVFLESDYCPGGTNSLKGDIRITDNFITVQPDGIGMRPSGVFDQVLTGLEIERNIIQAADVSQPITGLVLAYANDILVRDNIIDAPEGTAFEITPDTGVMNLQLDNNRDRAGDPVEPVYK